MLTCKTNAYFTTMQQRSKADDNFTAPTPRTSSRKGRGSKTQPATETKSAPTSRRATRASSIRSVNDDEPPVEAQVGPHHFFPFEGTRAIAVPHRGLASTRSAFARLGGKFDLTTGTLVLSFCSCNPCIIILFGQNSEAEPTFGISSPAPAACGRSHGPFPAHHELLSLTGVAVYMPFVASLFLSASFDPGG